MSSLYNLKDIMKIPKKLSDKNQAIYDFVKKYVRENQRGDFVCKSCGEYLKPWACF